MKYFILILLLPAFLQAQNELPITTSYGVEIDFDGLAADDSLVVDSVDAGVVVSFAAAYIDTTISGVTAVTITMRESQLDLLDIAIGPEDIIGATHVARPDVSSGGVKDYVVMHYAGSGSGRIRIFWKIETLR